MCPLQVVSNRNEETNDKHFSFFNGSMDLKSLKGTAKALMTLGVSSSYFPFCLFNPYSFLERSSILLMKI